MGCERHRSRLRRRRQRRRRHPLAQRPRNLPKTDPRKRRLLLPGQFLQPNGCGGAAVLANSHSSASGEGVAGTREGSVLRNPHALRIKHVRRLARVKANIFLQTRWPLPTTPARRRIVHASRPDVPASTCLSAQQACEPCPGLASLLRMRAELHHLHFLRATTTASPKAHSSNYSRKGVRARPDRCSSKQPRPRTAGAHELEDVFRRRRRAREGVAIHPRLHWLRSPRPPTEVGEGLLAVHEVGEAVADLPGRAVLGTNETEQRALVEAPAVGVRLTVALPGTRPPPWTCPGCP